MIVFYTYSVIEIVAQYNQVNGQYTYVQRVKGNMQVSYDDLPKLAKELGTSASHLQAVLENRARQLELKDGTIASTLAGWQERTGWNE